jgi:hypothetical protein
LTRRRTVGSPYLEAAPGAGREAFSGDFRINPEIAIGGLLEYYWLGEFAMRVPGSRVLAVSLVVGILIVGALGIVGVLPIPTRATPSSSPAAVSTDTAAGNVASTMAENALAATSAHGLNPRVISVPRPSATPSQVATSNSLGYVTPLYDAAPAPSGLAYYGLSEGKGGVVVPAILNTTRLMGQVNINGPGIFGQDLYSSSPDSYGLQLNAVTTNITLFGTHGYSFWTQNVVLYYPATHFMILVTNIWNFSGASISGNALYTTGLGCVGGSCAVDDFGIQGLLGYYYSELVIPFPVTYPFDLALFMNSTISNGRDNVSFAVDLSGPGESFNAPYDWVEFNSLNPEEAPLTIPSNYEANGHSYNPVGLTDDFELDLCGPNGGSNADLADASATLGLAYWSARMGSYEATPSAFNYGGETGETVTGANVAWANGAGGPAGLSDWATVSAGPTVLRGLWHAGAPAGTVPLTLAVTPANAFDIFTPLNNTSGTRNFVYAQPFAESNLYGPTFWLTPGNYSLKVELSDYDQVPQGPTVLIVHLEQAKTLTINLHFNPLNGVYTPLWAFTNAELAGISSYGAGTQYNPYMLFNNQYRPLAAFYGLYNDYAFPVYPGVFLAGTTASAYLEHAPQFVAKTSDAQYPGPYLPQTNELQFWFWSVSGVALVGAANISGWFGANAYYPTVWNSFNVVFYNSSSNLVAGNTFGTESQALLMYSGGTFFGPVNTGGGSNTVWGNSFDQRNAPSSELPLIGFGSGLGLMVGENADLVYNNWFATPTTAWMLPLNLYSGNPYLYTDTWNITPTKASHINYAPGFPLVPLTGSIAGGSVQGGNYWWDYGTNATNPNPYNGAVNPYGVLPYDENATTLVYYVFGPGSPYYTSTYIYNGGDYAPFWHPLVHLG